MAQPGTALLINFTVPVEAAFYGFVAQAVLGAELRVETLLVIGATERSRMLADPLNGTGHALSTLIVPGTFHVLITRRSIIDRKTSRKN